MRAEIACFDGAQVETRALLLRGVAHSLRALGETAISRYKHLIGPRLRARTPAGQRGEVALAVAALNRMIRVAKPVSMRVA